MRAGQIPGGPEFPNFNGAHSSALAQSGVMQPLVMNERFAAFQRFDHSTGCSATSDLVRGFERRKRLMTFTPKMDEEPLDVLLRFAPLVLHGNVSVPAADGAWSPDGQRFAYISPHRGLIIRSLTDGSQRVVADHVQALDW